MSFRTEPKPSARRVGSARMLRCGPLRVTAGILTWVMLRDRAGREVTVAAAASEWTGACARVKAPKKGKVFGGRHVVKVVVGGIGCGLGASRTLRAG